MKIRIRFSLKKINKRRLKKLAGLLIIVIPFIVLASSKREQSMKEFIKKLLFRPYWGTRAGGAH